MVLQKLGKCTLFTVQSGAHFGLVRRSNLGKNASAVLWLEPWNLHFQHLNHQAITSPLGSLQSMFPYKMCINVQNQVIWAQRPFSPKAFFSNGIHKPMAEDTINSYNFVHITKCALMCRTRSFGLRGQSAPRHFFSNEIHKPVAEDTIYSYNFNHITSRAKPMKHFLAQFKQNGKLLCAYGHVNINTVKPVKSNHLGRWS